MDNTDPQGELSITQVSNQLHLTPRAIRFYESSGLVSPRRVGTRRYYSPEHVDRLTIVGRCRQLEIPLDNIREILRAIDTSHDDLHRAALVIEHLQEHRSALALKQEKVAHILEELDTILGQLQAILQSDSSDHTLAVMRQAGNAKPSNFAEPS
jgi:DNA-binding transcriptional MerR regulator